MPQHERVKWAQLRVGIMVIVSLILFAVAGFFVSGQVGFFTRHYILKAYLPTAGDLREGAQVRLAGISVGNVSKIGISPYPDRLRAVEVDLKIARTYQNEIRADSVASVETVGLLGDSYVDITRGTPGKEVVADGGAVQTAEKADVAAVMQNTNEVILNLNALSAKLDDITTQIQAGKGSMGKLLYDETLYNKMNATVSGAQTLIDRAQHGPLAGHPRLGPATYKLVWHGPGGRAAYSFCICPGGMVVAAATEAGGCVTNGMSFHARDGANANAGLVVGIGPEDFPGDGPLAGVDFQREWERAAFRAAGGSGAPAQRLGDFLAGRASNALGKVPATLAPPVRPADLAPCLPPFVVATLRGALPAWDRQVRGFALPDAVMTGVETRTSSPVRIPRDDAGESPVPGLYPCGEGAGYAGGILSSAIDGENGAAAAAAWLSSNPALLTRSNS